MPRDDRSVLVVLKVDDKSVVGSWDYGENYYFQRVTWVNNERILYATSFKTGRFDFQVGLRDMYGSDIDGTSRIAIPHGNFYGIVDTLPDERSEAHTSELQSLMRTSYAVFCLKKKNRKRIRQQM